MLRSYIGGIHQDVDWNFIPSSLKINDKTDNDNTITRDICYEKKKRYFRRPLKVN